MNDSGIVALRAESEVRAGIFARDAGRGRGRLSPASLIGRAMAQPPPRGLTGDVRTRTRRGRHADPSTLRGRRLRRATDPTRIRPACRRARGALGSSRRILSAEGRGCASISIAGRRSRRSPAGRRPRAPDPDGRRRHRVRRLPGPGERADRGRDHHPARRPRAPPVLRGAGPPLRRGRGGRGRDRLLRADGRRRRPRAPTSHYVPHVGQMTWEGTLADIQAGAAAVREGGRVVALFAVGFCMGGRLAFLTPTFDLGMSGAIGFYGWPTGVPAELARAGRRRGRDARPDPGHLRRRRRGDHARRRRRVRARAGRRRGGPRARHLPGRSAQLLRPQGGRLRRGVDERLAQDAEVHPGEHARPRELDRPDGRVATYGSRAWETPADSRHDAGARVALLAGRLAGDAPPRRRRRLVVGPRAGQDARRSTAGSGCGSPGSPMRPSSSAFAWYGPPNDADLIVAPGPPDGRPRRLDGRLGRDPGPAVRSTPTGRLGGLDVDGVESAGGPTTGAHAAAVRPDLERRRRMRRSVAALAELGFAEGPEPGFVHHFAGRIDELDLTAPAPAGRVRARARSRPTRTSPPGSPPASRPSPARR